MYISLFAHTRDVACVWFRCRCPAPPPSRAEASQPATLCVGTKFYIPLGI